MDNAYMLFNRHRVPHSALLSKYASVDPDTGAYTKPKNPSSVYGSLTRVSIIRSVEPLFVAPLNKYRAVLS